MFLMKFDIELIKDKELKMLLTFTLGPEDDELIKVKAKSYY